MQELFKKQATVNKQIMEVRILNTSFLYLIIIPIFIMGALTAFNRGFFIEGSVGISTASIILSLWLLGYFIIKKWVLGNPKYVKIVALRRIKKNLRRLKKLEGDEKIEKEILAERILKHAFDYNWFIQEFPDLNAGLSRSYKKIFKHETEC